MKLIRPQTIYYDLNDVPVYGKVRFTNGSTDFLDSPNAMEFPRKSGGFLQSLGHAIVARVAFHEDNEATGRGLDGSEDYQKTSTVNIKYHDGKGWRSAFMELPDEEASFELAKAVHKKNKNYHELVIPRSEPLVARLVGLAEEAGRVRPVFEASSLKLSTKQSRRHSEYGSNPDVIARVGNAEIAELNASYLQKTTQSDYGFVHDFKESNVKNELKGKKDQALIKFVGLGGGDYYDIVNIDCNNNSGSSGRARGVVHGAREISDVVGK